MSPPPKDHRFDDVIDIPLPKGIGGRGTGWLVLVALLVLAVVLSFTTVYSIAADEVGVVLRFGKYVRQTEPGLHMKLPWGIESVYPVKIRHVYKEEFGYRTELAGRRTEYSPSEFLEESMMLTGDLNIVKVEWSVQYRIKDPVAYQFNVREVPDTIRDATESIMRKVTGDVSFDEAVTRGDELGPSVLPVLQDRLDRYEMGIEVELVKMQSIRPPTQVMDSFNKVNEAQQERETLVNRARESFNQIIPAERGRAEASIKEAEGYAIERVNRAQGDADRFLALLAEHHKAPEVTEQRLYLETMAELLPMLEKKYVVEGSGSTVLPILPWGSEKAKEALQ